MCRCQVMHSEGECVFYQSKKTPRHFLAGMYKCEFVSLFDHSALHWIQSLAFVIPSEIHKYTFPWMHVEIHEEAPCLSRGASLDVILGVPL